MNQVTIVGRLVRTPELKESENKRKMTFITVAVNRPFKSISGEYETDYIDCILWENTAASTVQYCLKGDIVSVRGRLQTRIVEKEGQKRSILEVVGERITFISSSTNKKDENTLDEKIEEEV